ncbi:ThiF family adenylyltransferase [Streptococcus thermophilus]
MKLKETVSVTYNGTVEKLIIKNGAKEYDIIDPNKTYYRQLENAQDLKVEKELEEFLKSKNLISPNFVGGGQIIENDRTRKYFEDKGISGINLLNKDINRIFLKNIIVIGCGGIGTVVLDNLVRAGFRKFTIIDFDKVEKSNLNRQLFYTVEDVGGTKIEIIKNKIREISPSSQITGVKRYISEKKDLLEILSVGDSLVINCADSPANIEKIISECSVEKSLPFISAFVGVETGTVTPIYDKDNFLKEEEFTDNYLPLKGSIPMTNMITGAFLSKIVFDYLFRDFLNSDYSFYSEHIINFEKLSVTNYE